MKANKFINYSNLRGWGYSSSKILATILKFTILRLAFLQLHI